MDKSLGLRKLPSVDEVLRNPTVAEAVSHFGRPAVVAAVRETLVAARADRVVSCDVDRIAAGSRALLEAQEQSNLKPVFNLTGTVLHTNLGRALLAESAVEAAVLAMRNAVALEFDLGGGKRGDRDDLVRDLLCELTGAEDATVVNNNAAAVLLVRRVPNARDHEPGRRQAGRGRHHQPHA
jgi:L-seryl-tRNA(Ser) seleniumtransferase